MATPAAAAPFAPAGLDEAEAAARAARGLTNRAPAGTSRTMAAILRANLLTRFNAILGALLLVIVVVGPIQDALFGIVLVTNAAIGIVQEWRAKRTLDRLSLVSAPTMTVVRSGRARPVGVDDIVLGDTVALAPGAQVVADGTVVASDGLEVDESLLTGESRPEPKAPGATVLSGSFVTAGHGWYGADGVGADAYAARLATEARRFSLVRSELRHGIDQILRVVTWLLPPTAVLLVSSQLVAHESLPEAVRGSVAGLGAMVPEGLVLLTSVAFAAGVVRLGRRRVLVQELAAIEGLARVDVVCVDKTGTITEPELTVAAAEPLVEGIDLPRVLRSLAAADPDPNASMRAIASAFPNAPDRTGTAAASWRVPFSSARRFSAVGDDGGGWVLGAPDVLLAAAARAAGHRPSGTATDRVEHYTRAGRRVMLAAWTPERPEVGLADLSIVGLVALEERIRPEAGGTLGFFAAQGVTVKVLSGDDPRTVAAVAARVGIAGADEAVDARSLPADSHDLAEVVEAHNVFGRVDPHQKRSMVHALQQRGHVVAMTGDGVNDVLALKEADLGVAMGSGSAASRAVAPVVLLDSSFAAFPAVVLEGRRVIANIERVANLFVTKTVYATLLALAVGVAQLPFPFLPRHLTVVSSLTIGVPAFFLALAPNDRRALPGFAGRVLRFAIPAGTVAAAATFAAYALAREEGGVGGTETRTTATITLFLVTLWVLAILARPASPWRTALVGTMGVGFGIVLAVPQLREFFALDLPATVVVMAAVGVASIASALLEAGWRVSGWVGHHHHGGRQSSAGNELGEARPPAAERQ